MRLKNLAIALGALGLVSTPLAAQTNDASGSTEEKEGIGQLAYLVIFAVLALAIGIAVSGNNNDPVSP